MVLGIKSSMYFHYVTFISLWQGTLPFIWKTKNRLYLGMFYVKYRRTWFGDSGEVNNMWIYLDGHLGRQSDRQLTTGVLQSSHKGKRKVYKNIYIFQRLNI